MGTDISAQHTVEDPDRELRRVLDRCVGLPLARWDRPAEDGLTPADALRQVLQEFADLAADATGGPRREVPRLRLHGLADQLTVLTREALAAVDDEGGRLVAARLVDLRRRF